MKVTKTNSIAVLVAATLGFACASSVQAEDEWEFENAAAQVALDSDSDWDFDQDVIDNRPQSLIGTGTGLVVGGLLGGPVGAMVGLIGGNILGQKQGLQEQLDGSQTQLAQLQKDLHHQHAVNEKLEESQKRLVASLNPVQRADTAGVMKLIEQGFNLAVQFRTASSELESRYRSDLDQLANVLKKMPQLHVMLEGYSDPRGSEQSNLILAQKRVDAVRQWLMDNHISADRIQVQAFGEQGSLSTGLDLEDYSFDRRVDIRFSLFGQVS